MKLNFWQILGLILVIIAVILIVRRQTAKNDTPTNIPPYPSTLQS